MAVDLDGVALGLVHHVHLLLVAEEHLARLAQPLARAGRRTGRTIMALTSVLPTISY
jgi:hypothetical protein